MDDRDLLLALSRNDRNALVKRAAAECFVDRHLKGMKKKAEMVKYTSAQEKTANAVPAQAAAAAAPKATAFIRAHAPQIAAALVGATVAAGTEYLSNKPNKRTGLSASQDATHEISNRLEERAKRMRKNGEEPGFTSEMSRATAKGAAGLSDVYAKHPGRTALMAAPLGAAAGLSILKLLKK